MDEWTPLKPTSSYSNETNISAQVVAAEEERAGQVERGESTVKMFLSKQWDQGSSWISGYTAPAAGAVPPLVP